MLNELKALLLIAGCSVLTALMCTSCARRPELPITPEGITENSGPGPILGPIPTIDSPFCEAIYPVTRELSASLGEGMRCITGDYSSTGYFGPSGDATESSFLQACFAGLERYESRISPSQRRVPIRTVVEERIHIDRTGLLDLSRYGLVPAMYRFDGLSGPAKANIKIVFQSPVMRTVEDLGYKLKQLECNSSTAPQVKSSIGQCRQQLCGEETVYTTDLVSARPGVVLTLERATARSLTTTSRNADVEIATKTPRVFTIKPRQRVNLAARLRRSRNTMIGHRACDDLPRSGAGEGGEVVELRGLRLSYQGCSRSHRDVKCTFSVMSPDRGKEVHFYVRSGRYGSSFVDDRGVPYTASYGTLAAMETSRYISGELVADVPTELLVEFKDVPPKVEKISQLTLHFYTNDHIDIELQNLTISGAAHEEEQHRCTARR